jgi:hypothetical protein
MDVQRTESSKSQVETKKNEESYCCSLSCKNKAMEITIVALIVISVLGAILAALALAGVPFAIAAFSVVAVPNQTSLATIMLCGIVASISGGFALHYHNEAVQLEGLLNRIS